ncbi:hypothetical protein N431DRAFT_141210 [Stipitochalara longipes BDJ]|nr:hypothetical protein N431DRAFT_141210 [Stipitochalara longipes BDJ]
MIKSFLERKLLHPATETKNECTSELAKAVLLGSTQMIEMYLMRTVDQCDDSKQSDVCKAVGVLGLSGLTRYYSDVLYPALVCKMWRTAGDSVSQICQPPECSDVSSHYAALSHDFELAGEVWPLLCQNGDDDSSPKGLGTRRPEGGRHHWTKRSSDLQYRTTIRYRNHLTLILLFPEFPALRVAEGKQG